jgi:hypothetical protein
VICSNHVCSQRFNASDVLGRTLQVVVWCNPESHWLSWLSQGNHIFSRLQITSNLENFGMSPTRHSHFAVTCSIVVIESLSFKVNISATAEDGPSGYLFLCPESEFRAGELSFRWPDCPAFWSLDPAGVECLSSEEATRFGFPMIERTTMARGKSWDPTVYAGLRQFHQRKGFDPNSQDVARHLGLSLYQLSAETEPLFAHGESIVLCHYSVLSF